MKKRTSKYANMNASDLARETRNRGLEKPQVLDISQWADWLEELDNPTKPAPVETTEDETDNSAENSTSDYSSFSAKELRAEAADGLTEDQQVDKYSDSHTEETG